MTSRRRFRQRSLVMVLGLIVAVAVVVVASIVFQNWWKSRPGKPPEQVTVHADALSNGSERDVRESIEVSPYIACEAGTECPEKPIPALRLDPQDTLHLTIPKDISDHDWGLLAIYDDPIANSSQYFTANQKNEVTIPATVEPVGADSDHRPALVVVEIKSMLIGHNDKGEEVPYVMVWSLNTSGKETIPPNEQPSVPASPVPSATPDGH